MKGALYVTLALLELSYGFVSDVVLVSLLLTLDRFHVLFRYFHCFLKQVRAGWDLIIWIEWSCFFTLQKIMRKLDCDQCFSSRKVSEGERKMPRNTKV